MIPLTDEDKLGEILDTLGAVQWFLDLAYDRARFEKQINMLDRAFELTLQILDDTEARREELVHA